MKFEAKTPAPKACDDAPIVPPPATVLVEAKPAVVLYRPDGTPLTRQIGFRI